MYVCTVLASRLPELRDPISDMAASISSHQRAMAGDPAGSTVKEPCEHWAPAPREMGEKIQWITTRGIHRYIGGVQYRKSERSVRPGVRGSGVVRSTFTMSEYILSM